MYGQENTTTRPISPSPLGGAAPAPPVAVPVLASITDQFSKTLSSLDEILRGIEGRVYGLGGSWAANAPPTAPGKVEAQTDNAVGMLSASLSELRNLTDRAAEVHARLAALV